MHAQKLRCHNGAGDCHHAPPSGPGLRAPGCQHHAASVVFADQPVALLVPNVTITMPILPADIWVASHQPTEVTLDPPFRPPTTSAVVL